MAGEYINKNEILEHIKDVYEQVPLDNESRQLVAAFKSYISNRPTADVVEVARCKNCRRSVKFPHTEPISGETLAAGWFCRCHRKYVDPDDYCSYGERRTDNDV